MNFTLTFLRDSISFYNINKEKYNEEELKKLYAPFEVMGERVATWLATLDDSFLAGSVLAGLGVHAGAGSGSCDVQMLQPDVESENLLAANPKSL